MKESRVGIGGTGAPLGERVWIGMPAMTRREAREEAFRLLFEAEFHTDAAPEEIYRLAAEDREFEDGDYIRDVFFGVQAKKQRSTR